MLAATCECFNLICIQVGYDHRSYERNLSLKKSGLQRGLVIAYLICYSCYCFESKDLEEKKKKKLLQRQANTAEKTHLFRVKNMQ